MASNSEKYVSNEKLDIKFRTLGDGMDNSVLTLSNIISTNHLKLPPISKSKSLKPVIPKGPIIKTVPKFVPNERKQPRYLTTKPKEPKFVPCEPYKCAIDPIIPRKKPLRVEGLPLSKNNIDIQELVHQMTNLRTEEMSKSFEGNKKSLDKQWAKEKHKYETDIKNLRETNAHLENQLKFQAQVNSELKTLLVAAVGEDLESRVQHLTEDKLQLARALLNQATHLTSHQEQTEWLSGQCEVWRSKFLASSLMVEELARWKSSLSNRISDLQAILKSLLDERNKVRQYSLKTYNSLKPTAQVLHNEPREKPKSANIIDLALNNASFAEEIAGEILKSKSGDGDGEETFSSVANTPGENAAVRILKNPVKVLSKPDDVCKALVGTAMSISSGQMYLQHPISEATCCKHCRGQMHDI